MTTPPAESIAASDRTPRADDSSVVEIRGVVKRFGAYTAVDALDLDVPRGGCFGLLGPNGAGKTTSLRMIYGVPRPPAGTIRVFGIDIGADPRAVRARLGVTLQENVLIEALSAVENLRIFGRYHRLPGAELSRRIEELVDFLELGSHARLPVRALSGGLQRRIAIAMSLINDPELLILDEPTTGLDPAVRLALWSRIRDLRARGTTVIVTTHYMDEAERLCDRVAIMSAGRRVCEGAPRELIETRLAREAVELDCTRAEAVRLEAALSGAARPLRIGNRLTLYSDDSDPVVAAIHRLDGGERRALIVRPANLEDVFLTATGAKLEGGA